MGVRSQLFCALLLLCGTYLRAQDDDIDETPVIDDEPPMPDSTTGMAQPVDFTPPEPIGNFYIADAFKDKDGIGRTWILSQAKKEGVDEDIAKYNGEWEIGEPEKVVLKNDYGLILRTRARHHAITTKLVKPFSFAAEKPFIVQYDVNFQQGQECGGGYIKLLSGDKAPNLEEFHDKTPYTIMFGPDKCGLTSKLHFIVRYTNPKSGFTEEHHAKQPSKSIENYITDKKSHVYTLIVSPDNSYEILIDQKQVVKGNLLETLEPAIVPQKEVDDPNDKKPDNWDDREKITDPDATKPEDWNEDAPEFIDDPKATKPDGWLDDEEEYIPDKTAVMPEDWDEAMDGKWEAPLVKNPNCDKAVGCGTWVPPQVKNPEYKGKWKAPMIENPNYKGKWKPKRIENPNYFEELKPFAQLKPIAAIGLELWSMSDNIIFDNFLITDDKNVADAWATQSWYPKNSAETRLANKSTFFGGLIEAANEKPWLWAVYILVILLPIVLIAVFCFGGSKQDDAAAKKTDAVQPDDVHSGQGDGEEEAPLLQPAKMSPKKTGATKRDELEESGSASQSEEEEEEGEEAPAEEQQQVRSSPRRRARKE